MKILTEVASKWGNLYRLRYYLNGRRITKLEADRLFASRRRKMVVNERPIKASQTWDWRTKWEIPA